MSRLHQENSGAARTGVVIAALLALCAGALWNFVVGRGVPLGPRIGLSAALALVVFLYGYFVSYVYADAERRGMRAGVWALVAALVPNALGFIAYFLLREPRLQGCATCGAAGRRDFAFCTQCGAPLRRACSACRRIAEEAWSHCAYCGTKITESAASTV